MLRVSVVLAIFSPCVCAYTGARLNPKTLTPAPPIKVVLMKVRLETSIRHTPLTANCPRGLKRGDVQRTSLHANQIQLNLCIAVLTRPKVQRRGVDFIDDWRGKTNPSEIDSFYIMLAAVASLDSYVTEFR